MSQSNLHVAVIMDGNGRWAARRSLPRLMGHREGAEALRGIVRVAPTLGIATLTAYAFSADNWKRAPEEVDALMELLAWYLDDETPRLADAGVRLSVIGRRDRLPIALLDAIERSEAAARGCSGLHLRLAIDYSSREAILRASTNCAGGEVTREKFEASLGWSEPVDLLIRTGGEQRLSDFMLWECAYAELFFTERMWPDFNEYDLREAVRDFRRRDRRFGAVPIVSAAPVAHERWLR
jgi:undecaprenyl diphosphate synthase